MTVEYRAQRLWRAANGIEDAEAAMRRSYRERARVLRDARRARGWMDHVYRSTGREVRQPGVLLQTGRVQVVWDEREWPVTPVATGRDSEAGMSEDIEIIRGYPGSDPLVRWSDFIEERDRWKSRAERAEADVDELKQKAWTAVQITDACADRWRARADALATALRAMEAMCKSDAQCMHDFRTNACGLCEDDAFALSDVALREYDEEAGG